MLLKQIQKGSGLVFSFFLVLHLYTSLFAAKSTEAFNSKQKETQKYYRPNFAVEIALVVIPLNLHIISSILIVYQRYKNVASVASKENKVSWATFLLGRHLPVAQRVHRYTAYFLLVVIVGHFAATRILTAFNNLPSDFGVVAQTLQGPSMFVFYPYYSLLFFSGLYHMAFGVVFQIVFPVLDSVMPASAETYKKLKNTVKTLLFASVGVLTVFGLVAICGFGGLLYPIDKESLKQYAALTNF